MRQVVMFSQTRQLGLEQTTHSLVLVLWQTQVELGELKTSTAKLVRHWHFPATILKPGMHSTHFMSIQLAQ